MEMQCPQLGEKNLIMKGFSEVSWEWNCSDVSWGTAKQRDNRSKNAKDLPTFIKQRYEL